MSKSNKIEQKTDNRHLIKLGDIFTYDFIDVDDVSTLSFIAICIDKKVMNQRNDLYCNDLFLFYDTSGDDDVALESGFNITLYEDKLVHDNITVKDILYNEPMPEIYGTKELTKKFLEKYPEYKI